MEGRYGWVVMGVLWLLDLSIPLMILSLGIVLPELRRDLSISPVQAGLLGAAPFVAFAAGSLPASLWLSRFSPKRVTLLAALGMAGSAVLQATAPTVEMLLLGRFLFMASVVSRNQAEFLILQQWFAGPRIAMINGITVGMFGLGQVLAVAGTPVLLALGGWRGFYLSLTALYLAIVLLWQVLGRERAYRNPGHRDSGSRVSLADTLRRHPMLWLLATSQFGGGIAFASFFTFFPTYAVDSVGYSLTEIGSLFAAFPIGGVVGSLSAGPISNVIGRRRPLIVLPGLLMPVLFVSILAVQSPVAMVPLLFVLGFCASVIVPIIFTIPYDLGLGPREVVVAVGLVMTITPAGSALGPVLVGAIQQGTGSLGLALRVVLPMAVTVGVIGLLLPETSPDRQKR